MSRARHVVASLLALLLAACAPAQHVERNDNSSADRPPVLLISIDGFHPDYLDRGLTPTLQALADAGVRARWMTPSFPSKTFPNHYTLVTGLVPDRHGVIDNTMSDDTIGRFSIRDPKAVGDGRWWQGEPIWVTARRAGLKTMTMFWPGSEAEIAGIRPDEWSVYDVGITSDERVDRVLSWLDRPPRRRPQLILTYLDDVDIIGHRHGPESPQLNAALIRVDAALSRLVAGLRERGLYGAINIVIVSDHGMAPLEPGREIVLDDLVNPAWVEIVNLGEITSLRPRAGHEDEVAAALATPRTGITCRHRDRLPAAWRFGRHARVPAYVCLLDEGWRISRRERFNPWQQLAESNLGSHGFDPELPSMRALFVARGPAFKSRLLVEPFQNIHVHPLLIHLLGIPGPATDGDPSVTAPLLRAAPSERTDQKSEQP